MLGALKNAFSNIPMLVLSATITPTVLEYIRSLLKFSSQTRIYWQSLDWPNLTYVVAEIKKLKYEKLDFLVPDTKTLDLIPKTMVFVDQIDQAIKITAYLRSRLPECIRNDSVRAKKAVRLMSSNLELSTRSLSLEDFCKDKTRI